MSRRLRLSGDRGLSPLIGITVLIALAVVSVAIISPAVFDGVREEADQQPRADFNYNWDPGVDMLTIEHLTGETFSEQNSGNLYIRVRGSTEEQQDWMAVEADSEVSVGDDFTLNPSGGDIAVQLDSGDTVYVVWTTTAGDGGMVIDSYTIP